MPQGGKQAVDMPELAGIERLVARTTTIMYVADATPERTLRTVSSAFAAALGHSSREAVSADTAWKAYLHPDDRLRVFASWAKGLTGEGPHTVEYRVIGRTGHERWLHEESTVFWRDGAPIAVHAFLVDITQSKAAEARLSSYAHDLRERVKELDCLYSITHLAEEGSVEQLLQRVVHILPRAWQYPERAFARIQYEGQTFSTDPEATGRWMQGADIVIRGETVGRVGIGYRGFEGLVDKSPFLKEEWSLLEGIARRLADAIERRRAEEALRRSEELYRTLAKNIPGAMVGLFDTSLHCTLAEGALKGALSKEKVEGRELPEVWNRRAAFLVRLCRKALEGHELVEEHRWQGLALAVHVLPLTSKGIVQGGMFLVQDVTERRHLEKEVLEIASREQRRVGQDLHDGLGQLLTGLMCLSGSLARNLSDSASPHAEEASEITDLVRNAMTEVRSLARGLIPVEIDARGLVPALQELAYDTENLLNVACECRCDPGIAVDEAVAAVQLYRITQEAISNAVRHGKATEIHISLTAEGDRGTLSIMDNGCGIQMSKKTSGMGLRIMKYRAEMIGASLEVAAREPSGTRISCSFPLKRA